MKLDCSKLSNKGDMMALVAVLLLAVAVGIALALAIHVDTFSAGFFSATIVWKWHEWLYRPFDAFLNRLWAQEDALKDGEQDAAR